MTSLKLRDGVAATAIGALLMLVLDAYPAHADWLESDLTPAESAGPSRVAEAGGTGQVWAQWRNAGKSTTSADARISAVAPDDQVFQRSGQLVIRTVSDDGRWVSIRPAIRIEEACELSNDGREIRCTLPSITISDRLAVRIGTFVAPGATVTTSWTTTSDATLAIDGIEIATPLHTFVGSRSTITNTVVSPGAGEQAVEGTAHPGSHIAVTLPGGTTGNATAGRDGRWSMTLPEGFGAASVAFTDISGRIEQGDDFYYNSYTFSASATGHPRGLRGNGQPESKVEVFDRAGASIGLLHIPADTVWSIDLPDVQRDLEEVTVVNTLSDGSVTRLGIRMSETAREATLNVNRQEKVPRDDDGGVDVFIAQLLDAEGTPIAGELIEFTIAGDADLTIRSGVSDRNGEATLTVTSPARVPYVLNVRSPGTGSEAAITS